MYNNIRLKSISVIIPIYNGSKTIIETLESVFNQTEIDWLKEVIIINDGSTDNSAKLITDYILRTSNTIIKLINTSNKGVSAARNLGMSISSGDWIALLDADDIWLSHKIETQVYMINFIEEIDFLGARFSDSNLRLFLMKFPDFFKVKVIDMLFKSFPQPSTVIFRRKIFDELGGFDTNQRYGEDLNYFTKICNKYQMYFLNRKLIILDNGKPPFGSRGASSDLRKMHFGTLKNLKDFKEEQIIDSAKFVFFYIFFHIKYLRRIILTRLQKSKVIYGL